MARSAATTSEILVPVDTPPPLFGVLNPGGDTAAPATVVVVDEVVDEDVDDELVVGAVVVVVQRVVEVVWGTVELVELLEELLEDDELEEELLLEELLDELLEVLVSVWAEANEVNAATESSTTMPARSEAAARRRFGSRVPGVGFTSATLVAARAPETGTRSSLMQRTGVGRAAADGAAQEDRPIVRAAPASCPGGLQIAQV